MLGIYSLPASEYQGIGGAPQGDESSEYLVSLRGQRKMLGLMISAACSVASVPKVKWIESQASEGRMG